jgi:hypothetical protein
VKQACCRGGTHEKLTALHAHSPILAGLLERFLRFRRGAVPQVVRVRLPLVDLELRDDTGLT